MSSAVARNSDDQDVPPTKTEKSAAIILFTIAADTTWRMFGPTLGGTLIGLWIDSLNNNDTWFGIGGLAVGIVITAFLIRQQYKQSNEMTNVK